MASEASLCEFPGSVPSNFLSDNVLFSEENHRKRDGGGVGYGECR